MKSIDRRTAIIGASAAVTLAKATQVRAQLGVTNASKNGGVQGKRIGEGKANIPGYKSVVMSDLIVQPGASYSGKMTMPMICHMTQGSLEITQDQGVGTFTANKDHIWTCNVDQTESGINKGNTPAIMRSIILMT